MRRGRRSGLRTIAQLDAASPIRRPALTVRADSGSHRREDYEGSLTMKRMINAILTIALGVSFAASAAEVDRRQERQQKRIAEGIERGQLTPGEAARLEKKEGALRQEIKTERAANGG